MFETNIILNINNQVTVLFLPKITEHKLSLQNFCFPFFPENEKLDSNTSVNNL